MPLELSKTINIMRGKEKCELLKAIRKSMAEMNGIAYDPEPCNHLGDCSGTCPKCEQETAWLMRELRLKEAHGSPIRIDTESIEQLQELALQDDGRWETDEEHHLMGDIMPLTGIGPAPEDVPDDFK